MHIADCFQKEEDQKEKIEKENEKIEKKIEKLIKVKRKIDPDAIPTSMLFVPKPPSVFGTDLYDIDWDAWGCQESLYHLHKNGVPNPNIDENGDLIRSPLMRMAIHDDPM